MTCSAGVGVPISYGLVVTGRCLLLDLVARPESHVVNPAPGRMGGMDTSTQIETLHFLAGTQRGRALCVMHCEGLMDSMSRTYRCAAGTRLELELSAITTAHARDAVCEEIRPLPEKGRDSSTSPSVWMAAK